MRGMSAAMSETKSRTTAYILSIGSLLAEGPAPPAAPGGAVEDAEGAAHSACAGEAQVWGAYPPPMPLTADHSSQFPGLTEVPEDFRGHEHSFQASTDDGGTRWSA